MTMSSQLNSKFMRSHGYSSAVLKFKKFRYHSKVLIQTIAMKVLIEKAEKCNLMTVVKRPDQNLADFSYQRAQCK